MKLIRNNLYEYPEYYGLVFGKRNIMKEIRFIEEVFAKFSGRVRRVLDIACGTGIHLEELKRRNYDVAGLDISKKMLSTTRKNLGPIETYHQDMRKIKISKKFDACICMLNSLAMLTENDDLELHLNAVARVLRKGGLYLIEMDNPWFMFSNPKPYEKPKIYRKSIAKKGTKIDVVYERKGFNLEKGTETNSLMLRVNDNGKIMKLVDDSPIRRFLPSEIKLFLKLNKKLKLAGIFGDFDWKTSINDKNSRKMIVILKKTG